MCYRICICRALIVLNFVWIIYTPTYLFVSFVFDKICKTMETGAVTIGRQHRGQMTAY